MKEEEERLKRLEEEDKICDYTSFSEVLSAKIKSTGIKFSSFKTETSCIVYSLDPSNIPIVSFSIRILIMI